MVVPGPLDYNLLLGHEDVYEIGAIVSTLFRVICFSHEGIIVTVDQLSFLRPNMASSQPSYLSGPFVPMVSSSPRVNYVANCSIPTSTDDQFFDVVHLYWGHWNQISLMDSLLRIPSRALFSHPMRTSWES